MSPYRHKQKLLKAMTRLREEVSKLIEDKHLEYPYKSLPEVELDIHDLTQEIERTELTK